MDPNTSRSTNKTTAKKYGTREIWKSNSRGAGKNSSPPLTLLKVRSVCLVNPVSELTGLILVGDFLRRRELSRRNPLHRKDDAKGDNESPGDPYEARKGHVNRQ